MDYLYYAVLVSSIVLVSLVIAKILAGLANRRSDAQRARIVKHQARLIKQHIRSGQSIRPDGVTKAHRSPRPAERSDGYHPGRRTNGTVPTPWGWPVHERDHRVDVSGQLHDFAEKLFAKKETVDSNDYMDKKNASVKALIEDRYGRASGSNMEGSKSGKPKSQEIEKDPWHQRRQHAAPRSRKAPATKPWGW
jgi:hypothetical protein